METVIIGGRDIGQELSAHLRTREIAVVFLDDDTTAVDRALDAGVDAYETDIVDVRALSGIGLDRAHTVIVATDSDSKNLLITQLLRVTFDTDRLVVLVNQPQNVALFDELSVEIISSAHAVIAAIENVLDVRHDS